MNKISRSPIYDNPELVEFIEGLYGSGHSLREIEKNVRKRFDLSISHTAIKNFLDNSLNLFQKPLHVELLHDLFGLLFLPFVIAFFGFVFLSNTNLVNQIFWSTLGMVTLILLGYSYIFLKRKYLYRLRKIKIVYHIVRFSLSIFFYHMLKKFINLLEESPALEPELMIHNFGFFMFNMIIIILMGGIILDLIFNLEYFITKKDNLKSKKFNAN